MSGSTSSVRYGGGVNRGSSYGKGEYINGPAPAGRSYRSGAMSIAELVLSKNQVPYEAIGGDMLAGYDIKSQDCTNMLKLSLLAETKGEYFKEVYCKPDGVVRSVIVGNQTATGFGRKLHQTTIGEYVNTIDHVIIKGRQPLPTRYQGGTVSMMGNGWPVYFSYNCSWAPSIKNQALDQEAWAEFGRSPQSPETQDLIRTTIVRRSKWEQLVGFKATFAGIPSYASMSISQTTPRERNLPVTTITDAAISVPLGDTSPDAGGLMDVSGVNVLGGEVLSIERGIDIIGALSSSSGYEVPDDINPQDYYVLLDHQCSIFGLSRGKNWFLVPGGSDSATVIVRSTGSSLDAWNVYYGLERDDVHFYRRRDGRISSVSQGYRLAQDLEDEVAISTTMLSNPARGIINVGMTGTDTGAEVTGLFLHYSVAKPSIKITSPHSDAKSIASRVAAGGVYHTSIVTQELPAPIGYNGVLVEIPAPPDEEGEKQQVDTAIDNLEGSIIDITAPFLSEDGVAEFSARIFLLMNEGGTYKSIVYAGGGYNALPGMVSEEGGVIQNIEYTYADKDSVTTNVTTGPTYQPIGSYSDSQYIKRSETVTRLGTVISGDNKKGIFIVDVEGKGTYEAILGTIEPVYPGDRVEVRILNVPVEE